MGQPYDCPDTCQTMQSIWIRLTTIKLNRNTSKHKLAAHYNPLNIHDQTGQIITVKQSPLTDNRLASSNNSFLEAETRVCINGILSTTSHFSTACAHNNCTGDRWASLHKGPVMWKLFSCYGVFMRDGSSLLCTTYLCGHHIRLYPFITG